MARASGGTSRSASAEIERRAAFTGCSRSWLAAARNRVFERLAVSASSLATASASLERSSRCISPVSSSVRVRTRPSSMIAVWNSE